MAYNINFKTDSDTTAATKSIKFNTAYSIDNIRFKNLAVAFLTDHASVDSDGYLVVDDATLDTSTNRLIIN